ncbi:hypothetical protein EC988_009183 [Linderina pennispora]|nr:hypothetical protein EC988_009183 [Linderina pennispora]
MRASPPQSMPPPHHHRHSMHSLQHLRQQAQMQPAQSIHLALPPPPPPAQAARVQMPPPTLTSQQKELKQQRLPPRLPPPVVTSHQVPTPYIPSPTTPTTIGRRGSMQSPSPIPSLQRQFSPPLSSAGTSQTVREHPENRRTRLASILNPIQPQSSVDGGMPVPRAPEPLPSLGSVLARVQSAEGTITPQHREPSPSVGSKASSPEKWRPW